MATQYKKDVAFTAFRNAWYRADTKDYRNIIDILMLVLGLRSGIIIQTEDIEKMVLFIETKLVHFPTGMRLVTKKAKNGFLYVSTPPNTDNISSIILDGYNGIMDDKTLAEFLGYSCPLTMDELYTSAKQPCRLKFCLGVMLCEEGDKETWYEPWCEVISLWNSREGLIMLSERLKKVLPNLRLFANMLDAITRSGRYVSYVEARINVLVPDEKAQTWMKFTQKPGPDGSYMSVCTPTTMQHMLPYVECTHEGFVVL